MLARSRFGGILLILIAALVFGFELNATVGVVSASNEESFEAHGTKTVLQVSMPCSSPQPRILRGSTGSAVRCAQLRLNTLIGSGLATDGIFGRLTESAVKNFQSSRGLPADGIVGPQTWSWLLYDVQGAPLACGYPNYPRLQRGSRGEAVRCAQFLLNAEGAHLALDGIFGTQT